jgi:O-antigen ligase
VSTTLIRKDRSLGRRRFPVHPGWIAAPAALLIGWVAGTSISAGGQRGMLAEAAGICVVACLLGTIVRRRLRADAVAVELPALFILMAELVFRTRDADSLATNPLDTAGLLRVVCIGLALLLSVLALTAPAARTDERVTTRPFRVYCLYVAVVFIGGPLSINWPLTAYRGVELLAGLLVAAGAVRRAGPQAAERILNLIYWFTAISAVIIWLEAIVMPGSAFTTIKSPFPFQLHGVFPLWAANSTGTIGAMLGLWSLARLFSPADRGGISVRALRILAALGFVTLAFAQYRTGLIVTVVGVLVILGMRSKVAAFWFVMAGVVIAAVWGPTIVHQAAPILQRGENPEVLSRLSGRLNYWNAALPVWRESPIFGRGLLTASRFEVLAKLGSVYTSSIHGTWVEALVGTGLVGAALLAASLLVSLKRAFRDATTGRRLVPLVLLVALLVRSLTGSTFEVASGSSLLFLAIGLLLRDDVRDHEGPLSESVLAGR